MKTVSRLWNAGKNVSTRNSVVVWDNEVIKRDLPGARKPLFTEKQAAFSYSSGFEVFSMQGFIFLKPLIQRKHEVESKRSAEVENTKKQRLVFENSLDTLLSFNTMKPKDLAFDSSTFPIQAVAPCDIQHKTACIQRQSIRSSPPGDVQKKGMFRRECHS